MKPRGDRSGVGRVSSVAARRPRIAPNVLRRWHDLMMQNADDLAA